MCDLSEMSRSQKGPPFHRHAGGFTITSITPSVGCVSPPSHHSCHPNMMDFDEMPPTRLGSGSVAVPGHTLRTSI